MLVVWRGLKLLEPSGGQTNLPRLALADRDTMAAEDSRIVLIVQRERREVREKYRSRTARTSRTAGSEHSKNFPASTLPELMGVIALWMGSYRDAEETQRSSNSGFRKGRCSSFADRAVERKGYNQFFPSRARDGAKRTCENDRRLAGGGKEKKETRKAPGFCLRDDVRPGACTREGSHQRSPMRQIEQATKSA